MGVDTKHPAYVEKAPDWEQLRATYGTERGIKEAGVKYLPMTPGMVIDGAAAGQQTKGGKSYSAYRARAVFPEVLKQGVNSVLGVMHHKPPVIELPAKMEPLLERATLRGESLEMLLRRINEEQLITGRVGLMLEVPDAVGPVLPHIVVYEAEDVINWDEEGEAESGRDSLNLVVLDESEDERTGDGFEWKHVEKYRVLQLGNLVENEAEGTALYGATEVREGVAFSDATTINPSIAGKTLDQIPFVFVNTSDITAEPDHAPLIGLSNLSLTIYRGEADYRQALYLQGQDTLVIEGGTSTEGEELRTGAGAVINVPMGGGAEFIGVDSSGLSEMRTALENDYSRAESQANGLLEAVSRSAESGEALRVRVSARTASLNQIAMTSAFALQEILRIAAVWLGLNPEDVIVTPNLDFVSDRMPGAELVGFMTAKGLGAPLSLQTIHEQAQERGVTSQTWEDELARLEKEAEDGLPGAVMPGEGDSGATDEGAPMEDDELDDEDDDAEDEGDDADDAEDGDDDEDDEDE